MAVFFDPDQLAAFIAQLGVWGPVVFFVLQVVQAIVIPIPGNLLTMVGGALFGIWPGFLLAYTANVVGSVIGFCIARKAGRAVMAKLMGEKRFHRYMEAVGAESAHLRAKILLILVLVLPFLPSDFMCLAAGVTSITFKEFLIIVILCRPWGQFAAALLGVGSMHMPLGLLIPLLAAVVAICVLAVYFAPKIEKAAVGLAHKLTDRFFS